MASRDQARADAYAREHGIANAHGSYEALLADPSIDAVYISLPNGLHCEWSKRALEAGKHVLCEKPMSSDPSAVAAVFDVAEAHGLVLHGGVHVAPQSADATARGARSPEARSASCA